MVKTFFATSLLLAASQLSLAAGSFCAPNDMDSALEKSSNKHVRFATFNAYLNRNSSGELIADLSDPNDQLGETSNSDLQTRAVAEIIQRVNPDVLLLNEFDFEHWRKTKGKDPTIVDGFLRSAAGVFAAVYVCGMIDFNSSALAVKDGESLFLREYETIVQPGQCRYASRVLIPKQMKACLKALKVWDTFIHNTERAFSVLQTSCDSLLHVMGSLCEKSDVSDGQANQYLGSIIARKRGQKNEKKTIELFRKWLI